MNVQVIKSLDGREEYVLLPMAIYRSLKQKIDEQLATWKALETNEADYVPFDIADYIQNPVRLARVRAGVLQKELARRMKVSQAYISKIERANKVSPKVFGRVKTALEEIRRAA